MVVTEAKVWEEDRDQMVGPLLSAALCDEAARSGVSDVVALPDDPDTATLLRTLGFVPHRSARRRLLTLPE